MIPPVLTLLNWATSPTAVDVTVTLPTLTFQFSLQAPTVYTTGTVGGYVLLPSTDPVILRRQIQRLNKILADLDTRLNLLES